MLICKDSDKCSIASKCGHSKSHTWLQCQTMEIDVDLEGLCPHCTDCDHSTLGKIECDTPRGICLNHCDSEDELIQRFMQIKKIHNTK